jgi:hypothetical protein
VIDAARRCELAIWGLALCAWSCRTREETARRVGREAAQIALRDCASDAGISEGCRALLCRDRCSSFADSVVLGETCTNKCLGQGTCDSDADCDRGLFCTMIAPRLRRCVPARDLDAEGF